MRLFAFIILLMALAPSAYGQALSPMRHEVVSFGDRFALRLTAHNPYRHVIHSEFKVYEEDWTPIHDLTMTSRAAMLGPGSRQPLMVILPFGALPERTVLVCHETKIAVYHANNFIRGQVCGRYRARRLALSQ